MRIVMVASEVAPFSKEGGLADVIGALPAALSRVGQEVAVVSPLYRGVRQRAEEIGWPLERIEGGELAVPIDEVDVPCVAWRSRLPDADVTVYFIQNERYYDRGGYYTSSSDHTDYPDNSERFICLSRGALELCRRFDLRPDVIHTHDWHTGLVPVYVRHVYAEDFPQTATVFTVHNLAYQGIFWHWDMKVAGLPWDLFNWRMLEYYGNLCFLKAGLVGADVLTTVSRTYSREIQTEEYGCGMHGVLRERAEDLFGIINGIDERVWDPETDEILPARYSAADMGGKAECKRALQSRFGLATDAERPLAGMVCRLVDQKGLDILTEALPELLATGVQLVVLGRGEPRYQAALERAAAANPDRLGLLLQYDEKAAHLIEAGSDMFLMPSRFEPCGLNQLYSMKYGTVPVVRATGGLADTVTDCTEASLAAGEATGFVFRDYAAPALVEAVKRAIEAFGRPESWRRLGAVGMARDWSWNHSASQYVEVYEEARRRREAAASG